MFCFWGGVESQKENHITWVELFFFGGGCCVVRVIHWHQVLKNHNWWHGFTWKNWVLPTKVAVLPVPDLGEWSGKSPWVCWRCFKGKTSEYPYQNIIYTYHKSYIYMWKHVKALLWSHIYIYTHMCCLMNSTCSSMIFLFIAPNSWCCFFSLQVPPCCSAGDMLSS